ncbi:mucosa-associated lymphoid tissue lymphoma translocation protein 1-like isoform X1 [Falco peregrinus]|uniref:mucosa-associated lymphoid tissue lymphoma translocation protein 1-like isoform X1 n=1 Tax=Falco peregrinus TaxID=8954 RepID=UPI0024791684|nr:mucosa-associated lymphoid tissue lymphoma translocation protein 1-like isoform X1 [Falco peregrinus]XP_055675319.1 mucosa-associated lymphoid tissue lymphoma translocation protein 1-like isoform X1 [Falco peregrinus]
MQEAIVITEQPVSVSVPAGYAFTLRCRAEGRTPLQYQWFCQHQSVCCPVPGATRQDLPVTAQQTQLYTCRINDLYKNAVFTNWVKVEVHQCVARGLPPRLWQGEPVIILNPMEQSGEVGKPLQLQCAAMGVPAPRYQWYRNGNLLEHQKKKKLWITHAKVNDSGTYLCCASNSHGECWTSAVDIHIDMCRSEKFFATGKIALLVGNNHYQHHPNLMAPVTDVFELSLLLEQLSFQVVSLLDLNKAEMVTAISRFLQLLGKGVYAIFYYAGHGYEHSGRNYMVPIDAPQPYAPENCISVQRILQKMQQQQTALNLILLDTCRKWYNPECALSQVQPLEPWGNTIYGYATNVRMSPYSCRSEDAEAYELQDGEFTSGIFMKYLKKHILQEKKVTHMLEDVLEDIGQDPLVTGKQVMEIKHTLKEARSLTDPICPLGATAECWGCSHEPLSKMVIFPCGAQVELHFHWLFSNLMYVCAKLQPAPDHVADARLLLCQPTEMDHTAILKEYHLDQVESLLASVYKREELDCVFQLCGLQKIQTDVVLQLDLHYTQLSTKQRTCESLQTTLQKSLLGQFFSQRNYSQPSYQTTPACTGSMCLQVVSVLSGDPKGQASLRTGSGHSLPSSNPSNSSGEPEENDENDLSELCSALLRAGPGQDYP